MHMGDEQFVFDSRLDGEFLNSIYEDDKEHAEMIFEKFMASIGGQLDELETSYASGNVEVFRSKMHKLKPLLSFVGLTGLTAQAEVIEKKCKQIDDLQALGNLYATFKSELALMMPVVENELTKLKA